MFADDTYCLDSWGLTPLRPAKIDWSIGNFVLHDEIGAVNQYAPTEHKCENGRPHDPI